MYYFPCSWCLYKGETCATSLKIDNSGSSSDNEFDKEMYDIKEDHRDIKQTFADDSSSDSTLKKCAAEFKWDKDDSKDNRKSGHLKVLTSDE